MAIDPKLVSIKTAGELPVSDPTDSANFLFYEGEDLKRSPMSNIYDKVSSGLLPATTTTVPEATGFHRYLVHTAGTYTNFSGIVVTAADLDIVNGVANNEVILEVNNGVASKKVRRLKGDTGASTILPFSMSTFPLVASVSQPVIRIHGASIWQLKDGATATATDVPGASDLWLNLSADYILGTTNSAVQGVTGSINYLGAIVSSTGSEYSDFIPVKPGDRIEVFSTFRGGSASSNRDAIIGLGDDKTTVVKVFATGGSVDDGSVVLSGKFFDIPEGVSFVRGASKFLGVTTAQRLKINVWTKSANILEKMRYVTAGEYKAIPNKTGAIGQGGVIYPTIYNEYSDFIPVIPGDIIVVNATLRGSTTSSYRGRIVAYTTDKIPLMSFVTGGANEGDVVLNEYKIIIPDNVYWVRGTSNFLAQPGISQRLKITVLRKIENRINDFALLLPIQKSEKDLNIRSIPFRYKDATTIVSTDVKGFGVMYAEGFYTSDLIKDVSIRPKGNEYSLGTKRFSNLQLINEQDFIVQIKVDASLLVEGQTDFSNILKLVRVKTYFTNPPLNLSYTGQKIDLKRNRFAAVDIANLTHSNTIQSACWYGDYIFFFVVDGNNNCNATIVNRFTCDIIKENVTVPIITHANFSFFGNEFASANDEFPAIYLHESPTQDEPGKLVALSFSFETGFTIIKKYPGLSGGCTFDRGKNEMYITIDTYKENGVSGLVKFYANKHRFPRLSEDVNIADLPILATYDLPISYIGQAATIHNGYMILGIGLDPHAGINIYDLYDNMNLVTTFDLVTAIGDYEPEGVMVIDGDIHLTFNTRLRNGFTKTKLVKFIF